MGSGSHKGASKMFVGFFGKSQSHFNEKRSQSVMSLTKYQKHKTRVCKIIFIKIMSSSKCAFSMCFTTEGIVFKVCKKINRVAYLVDDWFVFIAKLVIALNRLLSYFFYTLFLIFGLILFTLSFIIIFTYKLFF